MKHLAKSAALTLVAGLLCITPGLAQQEAHDTQKKAHDTQQQPREYDAQRETDRVQETGLRPDSKGGILVAPTIIGEILEVEKHAVLLDTVVGKEYIVRVPQTDVDVDLKPGTTVAVDFHRTSHGVRVAAQIREPRSEDTEQMTMMEKDYKAAMREDYELTSFEDGSYKAKAKGAHSLGHTAIGTVVSVDNEQIVVATSTGNETLVITPRTTWTLRPKAGDMVAVDFNRTEQQVPIATEIRSPEQSQ